MTSSVTVVSKAYIVICQIFMVTAITRHNTPIEALTFPLKQNIRCVFFFFSLSNTVLNEPAIVYLSER